MVPGHVFVSFTIVEKNVSERWRTWGRGERVGGTKHNTAGLDGIQTLPNHCNDGTSSHVFDQAREEGFVLEILVV